MTSTTTLKPAKQYARMICDHLKQLSNQYAEDPDTVRIALGLTEAEFQLGLNWCVERKIIELEVPAKPTPAFILDDNDPLDSTQDAPPLEVEAPALASV
jgi:hypothetical protein